MTFLSAGLVGMALGAMFIAPLADRFGRRRMILWGLVIIGFAMMGTAMAESIGPLILGVTLITCALT